MRVEKEIHKALIFRSLFPNKPPGMRTKHNHKRLFRISWLRFWILKKKKCRSAPWLWPFTLKVKIIVRSNYKKKAKLPDQLIKHWNPHKWSSHRASCYFLVWSPTEHHLEVITIAKPNHMYDQWLLTIDMYYTGDRLWARFLGWGEILSRFLLSFTFVLTSCQIYIFCISPMCRLRSPSSNSICTVFYLSWPIPGLVVEEKKMGISEIWIWKMQREYKYWELIIWFWKSGLREDFQLESPTIL